MTLAIVMILAYTVVFPALVAAMNYRSYSSPLMVVSILFWIALAAEIGSTIGRVYFHNSLWVINTYVICEAFLLILFFERLFKTSIIWPMRVCVSLVGVIEMFFLPGQYLSVIIWIEVAFVIGAALFLFYQVSNGYNFEKSAYWITVVLLIYFATSGLHLALRPYMHGTGLLFLTWTHMVTNAICNILYGVILWKAGKSSSLLLA